MIRCPYYKRKVTSLYLGYGLKCMAYDGYDNIFGYYEGLSYKESFKTKEDRE